MAGEGRQLGTKLTKKDYIRDAEKVFGKK